MTRLRLASLAFALCAAAASDARAGLSYPDFSSTAGLTLNGNAAQVGDRIRVAPASSFQSGSFFTTASTPLGNLSSFSTHFQFQITNDGGIGDGDGQGADGITFTVQTVANNVGGAGGGLGYVGIGKSLAIEFDTYNNGLGAGDPDGNHVGVDVNGSVNSLVAASEAARFNNGKIWNAWIDYNGNTHDLFVNWSMSSVRPGAAQLTYNVDLTSILGQNDAFLGFTSGTGSGWGDHDILNWEYRDEFNPITGVPEPGTIAGAVCGLLAGGLAWSRARRGSGRG